jgi:hypothetical protein
MGQDGSVSARQMVRVDRKPTRTFKVQGGGRDDHASHLGANVSETMKADYIKLSSRSVEATGRYVPAAIWSFLALRLFRWAGWLIISLVVGGSAWGFAWRLF